MVGSVSKKLTILSIKSKGDNRCWKYGINDAKARCRCLRLEEAIIAVYNKFQGWVGYVGLAATNLNTDTYNVYLTNATPSASADDVKTDLADITNENGYSPSDETNTYSESSGTGTGASTDVTWTASGGTFGPFRYVASYSDTHASDILRNWWDYGSAITPAAGESFTVDFGASTFTIT